MSMMTQQKLSTLVGFVQALGPEEGQAFLDIGSGTGYLTMVAANLVGHTGKAVGLEVPPTHYMFAPEFAAVVILRFTALSTSGK